MVLAVLPLDNLGRIGKAHPFLVVQGRQVLGGLVDLIENILLISAGPPIYIKPLLDDFLVYPGAALGIRMKVPLVQGFNIPVNGRPVIAVLMRQQITALIGEGDHGLGNQIFRRFLIWVLHRRRAGRTGKVVHSQEGEGEVVFVDGISSVNARRQLIVCINFLYIGN